MPEKPKPSEFEGATLTGLMGRCLQRGLDPTGDKPTLIARLLGKEKPEPEPKTAAPVETSEPEVPEPEAGAPEAEPEPQPED